MRVLEAKILTEKLMSDNRLTGWTLRFDSAKRRFGQCQYSIKVISLSKILVECNDEATVRDTILHEIAHAMLPRGTDHSPIWSNIAKTIGSNGRQYYDSKVVVAAKARWIGKCPVCPKQYFMHRRTTKTYFCTPCLKQNKVAEISWTLNNN